MTVRTNIGSSEFKPWLARDSFQYCRQPVFELICATPHWSDAFSHSSPGDVTTHGSPGTRYNTVANQFLNLYVQYQDGVLQLCHSSPRLCYAWPARDSSQYCGQPVFELVAPICHRHIGFNFSSPWQTKKPIPGRVLAFLVARQGLEPWTHALKGRCSTN